MNRPETIRSVTDGQFSLARYSGGCTVNGAQYHYDPENDELARMDIWRSRLANSKKAAAKAAAAKRDLEAECKRLQSLLDSAYVDIKRLSGITPVVPGSLL